MGSRPSRVRQNYEKVPILELKRYITHYDDGMISFQPSALDWKVERLRLLVREVVSPPGLHTTTLLVG